MNEALHKSSTLPKSERIQQEPTTPAPFAGELSPEKNKSSFDSMREEIYTREGRKGRPPLSLEKRGCFDTAAK